MSDKDEPALSRRTDLRLSLSLLVSWLWPVDALIIIGIVNLIHYFLREYLKISKRTPNEEAARLEICSSKLFAEKNTSVKISDNVTNNILQNAARMVTDA